jgi:hypothetical protein
LVELESNGINVDRTALGEVEAQFRQEKDVLSKRLTEIVEEVMGDTPINLNSGADMTKVVYSRYVIDRGIHQQVFNIGVGGNGKPLRPPRMKPAEFNRAVRSTTAVIQKTMATCCGHCNGRGRVQKIKKNGDPFKNMTKCHGCNGAGAYYQPTGKTAGLRLTPSDPSFASINGFKTDKNTIQVLISQAELKGNDLAIEFLTGISRLNLAQNSHLHSGTTLQWQRVFLRSGISY